MREDGLRTTRLQSRRSDLREVLGTTREDGGEETEEYRALRREYVTPLLGGPTDAVQPTGCSRRGGSY